MRKIIAAIALLSGTIFTPPGLTQVIIDFQTQPTKHQLIKVVENATKDMNYSTALRVANNAIKLFPDLAAAYYYRAISFYNLGKSEAASLDFEQAKKLYLNQLKDANISTQEKSEARVKLEKVERQLKLLKP